MNDKLTLEELAAYLPFNVNAIDDDGIPCKITTLYDDLVCVEYEMNVGQWEKQFNEIQLVLHPLSDLTKKIEVNGEKFIPLLKIADFLGIKYLNYEVLGNSIDFILNPSYSRENSKSKELRKVRFWLNTFKTKSFNCTNAGLMRGYDQYGAFQKLLSWNFDIFGLIDRGLAIDINSLN